jgi:DnaJ family protein A protein 5
LFHLLASDEALHTPEGQTQVHYPPFGDSTTPYAPPPGLTKAERAKTWWVRDFYVAWGEFTTEKRFEWLEKWDTTRGEDRNIRRLMEKENKKLREDHRKEYIDAVRSLAQFIQHRDPRYKAYLSEQARAKKAKKATSAQASGQATPNAGGAPRTDPEAARRREQERMKAAEAFQEQDWQKIKPDTSDEEEEMEQQQEQGDGTGIRMDDGAGGEIFECVACSKTFQSEASWTNHERSKKHKQAVWR